MFESVFKNWRYELEMVVLTKLEVAEFYRPRFLLGVTRMESIRI